MEKFCFLPRVQKGQKVQMFGVNILIINWLRKIFSPKVKL